MASCTLVAGHRNAGRKTNRLPANLPPLGAYGLVATRKMPAFLPEERGCTWTASLAYEILLAQVRPCLEAIPAALRYSSGFLSGSKNMSLPVRCLLSSALKPALVATCGLVVVSASLVTAPTSVGQELPDEEQVDETPEVVPQQESIQIEPYTGPPIFLPDPPPTPPATEVETTEVTDYYDREEKQKPRTKRKIVRYSDNSRKSHGTYEEFFESGETFVKGEYRHGVPVGTWEYFHENGAPAKVVTYEDGKVTGEVEVKREDGTLLAVRNYSAGKRTGDWVTYNESGEKPLVESHYSDGKPDGVWQLWHSNGEKRQQIPFVDGKRDGTVLEWSDDGEKRAEATFVDGLRDGVTRLYLPDGRQFEQVFSEGKQISSKEIK